METYLPVFFIHFYIGGGGPLLKYDQKMPYEKEWFSCLMSLRLV